MVFVNHLKRFHHLDNMNPLWYSISLSEAPLNTICQRNYDRKCKIWLYRKKMENIYSFMLLSFQFSMLCRAYYYLSVCHFLLQPWRCHFFFFQFMRSNVPLVSFGPSFVQGCIIIYSLPPKKLRILLMVNTKYLSLYMKLICITSFG